MDIKELARWMREEHGKVEDLANALVRHVAALPATDLREWIRGVSESFHHFRAHLVRHMALEEQGDYLAPVVERRPTLSGEVDLLNHEHGEMMQIAEEIHRTLHALTPEDRLLARDCCQRIESLLSYVRDHEHRENLLVLAVFTEDIGTTD